MWAASINTLRPRQHGRHFSDYTFKRIFLNENVWILIKISLNFVPKGSIDNILALVQIMAWRRPGDKPLSEPVMNCLLMHICVTRPQWVNKRGQIHQVTQLRIEYYSDPVVLISFGVIVLIEPLCWTQRRINIFGLSVVKWCQLLCNLQDTMLCHCSGLVSIGNYWHYCKGRENNHIMLVTVLDNLYIVPVVLFNECICG